MSSLPGPISILHAIGSGSPVQSVRIRGRARPCNSSSNLRRAASSRTCQQPAAAPTQPAERVRSLHLMFAVISPSEEPFHWPSFSLSFLSNHQSERARSSNRSSYFDCGASSVYHTTESSSANYFT